MGDVDDAYYYYYGFENYVPTTNDTGPWMLIGVSAYSLCCLLVLPIMVKIGKKRIKRQMRGNDTYMPSEPTSPSSHDHQSNEEMVGPGIEEDEVSRKSFADEEGANEDQEFSFDDGEASNVVDDESNEDLHESIEIIDTNLHGRSPKLSKNLIAHCQSDRQTYFIKEDDLYSMCSVNTYSSSAVGGIGFSSARSTRSVRSRRSRVSRGVVNSDMYKKQVGIMHFPCSQSESHKSDSLVAGGNVDESLATRKPLELCQETRRLRVDAIDSRDTKAYLNGPKRKRKSSCGRWYDFIAYVANWDEENKAIFKLAAPLTVSSLSYAIFDAISTALISRYLGSEVLSAYIVTNLLIGLSDTFINGVGDALGAVCSHAIGMGNYKLAGQYVQIGAIVYGVFAIPCMGIWWFKMGDCIELFGLDDKVTEEGVQYTKIVIFHYLMSGIFEGYTVLLDINGQVLQGTVFDIIASFFDMASTWLILAFVEDVNLFWIGLSQFAMSLFSLILFTAIAYFKGWLDPFLHGMTKTFALKNIAAVKNMVKMSIPLSLGNLMSYGEWEALTFFAAFLGPAEVTAWGLFEAIWGLMEAASGGSTDAGSIRLGMHLGSGNIEKAKLCTWKCLFLSTCLAVLETSLLFMCGEDTAKWFTSDKTLQDIMKKMIPMVGFANILMVFGMISWSLVGTQGRYRLATTINAIMSFCVTIPLAAIFCVVFRFTLDGLVGAVVIGYSTTGLCLAYILIVSDWEHISRTIREANTSQCGSESSESSSDDDYDDDSVRGLRSKNKEDDLLILK